MDETLKLNETQKLNYSLLKSCSTRDASAVADCLAHGADPNCAGWGAVPLQIVCRKAEWQNIKQSTQILKMLLAAGADPSSYVIGLAPLYILASRIETFQIKEEDIHEMMLSLLAADERFPEGFHRGFIKRYYIEYAQKQTEKLFALSSLLHDNKIQ